MLEYTAHAAVAEVRSLVTPGRRADGVGLPGRRVALQPRADRPPGGPTTTLRALRVAVATELVVAVRALRLAGQEPVGAGNRALWEAAAERLNPDLSDRPLHPDVEIARELIEDWQVELG